MSSFLSSKWNRVKLSEIGEIVTGSTPPQNNPEYFGDEIPFITPAELDMNKPLTKAAKFLSSIGASRARVVPAAHSTQLTPPPPCGSNRFYFVNRSWFYMFSITEICSANCLHCTPNILVHGVTLSDAALNLMIFIPMLLTAP